jgi:hypothetical protein
MQGCAIDKQQKFQADQVLQLLQQGVKASVGIVHQSGQMININLLIFHLLLLDIKL